MRRINGGGQSGYFENIGNFIPGGGKQNRLIDVHGRRLAVQDNTRTGFSAYGIVSRSICVTFSGSEYFGEG